MKRHLGILMALAMIFTCFNGTTAFAAESEIIDVPETVVSETDDNEIVPYGALSGYGWGWHGADDELSGNFYVDVKGTSWVSAQITVNIEEFASNVRVIVELYRPDGSMAWSSSDKGQYITMANKDDWHNIKFWNAPTGTYRVHYLVVTDNGTKPSSGRINCWIY